MKLQDFFEYDSTILGLNNLYCTVGDNSFYINSPSIVSNDHIITSGSSYVLVRSSQMDGIVLQSVDVIDVYYVLGTVHILLLDNLTKKRFTIVLHIDNDRHPCFWRLIDLNYLTNKLDCRNNACTQ
jgi:hypothetical protein